MDKQLATAEEMGSELGLSPKTILAWANKGKIPCLRISPKVVRFSPDEVLTALRREPRRRILLGARQ